MRRERHKERNSRRKNKKEDAKRANLRCRIVKRVEEKRQSEILREEKLRGILAEKQESSTGRG